ncbi:hypothetical protein [Streptomyces sp. RFCAC02]|uniref:hypothetical protein n=1 Tax=Streptomyces sp. RFCAC02 TaxID=2499143 RepID=UPI00101F33CA|nr:hypothetical protein [Streptomyces sp. RFCAC02]
MRIRTALSTGALAVAIVLGGAGGAIAHGMSTDGGHDGSVSKTGAVFGGCGIFAGIVDDNPVYGEGCAFGGFKSVQR